MPAPLLAMQVMILFKKLCIYINRRLPLLLIPHHTHEQQYNPEVVQQNHVGIEVDSLNTRELDLFLSQLDDYQQVIIQDTDLLNKENSVEEVLALLNKLILQTKPEHPQHHSLP